jgi:hypothetical protein
MMLVIFSIATGDLNHSLDTPVRRSFLEASSTTPAMDRP